MSGYKRDLRQVGTIMDRVARAPRTDDRLLAIRDVWADAVGKDVARNAFPVRINRAGSLTVHCSGATWAAELTLLRSHLQARLDERLGEGSPEELRFEVGELPAPVAEPEPPSPRTPNPRAAELASGIADPDLRRTVERAIAVRFGAPS